MIMEKVKMTMGGYLVASRMDFADQTRQSVRDPTKNKKSSRCSFMRQTTGQYGRCEMD